MEMTENKATASKMVREQRQLRRLEVLMDVIYGIVIWRIFVLLPTPMKEQMVWDSIDDYLSANLEVFGIIILSVVIVIIYWIQNNALFGHLERTDNKHTAISILQIFFLLLFLFAIRLGINYGESVTGRLFESITAALVGIASTWGWHYAMKDRRLLSPDVTSEQTQLLAYRIKAEPITALITIPCAIIGPILWELAWFSYPFFVFISKRIKQGVVSKK